MFNAKKALTNLMENAPVYKDYRSPAFTTTTGAVGSYMMFLDMNIALNGYVPVSATITAWAHVSYLPFVTIQNNNTLRVILVRNGSGAATYPAGDFTVRVGYQKE